MRLKKPFISEFDKRTSMYRSAAVWCNHHHLIMHSHFTNQSAFANPEEFNILEIINLL